MSPELPATDPASPWVQHLERAHALAHVAARTIGEQLESSPYLAPAARRLEGGLCAMYDAFDGRSDRPTAIALARIRLWDAAVLVARGGLPDALAALREACGDVISAEERLPRTPLAGRVPGPLRAGDELPPLHTIERASIPPAFRAPRLPEPEPELPPAEEQPAATTFEELAAIAAAARRHAEERLRSHAQPRPRVEKKPAPPPEQPLPGFVCSPPPPMSEDDFTRRWARECIDDIGMLGIQRTPQPGDEWRACLALERRLVAAIDAVAAFGPVAVRYIEPYVMDAPAADPMKMFAIAMLGGCLDGRDVLAGAERVLHRFGPGDPAIARAFASAMKLAPNPFVPNVLRALSTSTDPACRAIGVEVLAHRMWLTPEELTALADEEEPRVFALALPALAVARHRDLERALTRALAHADLRVQEAALDAMALASHPRAASAAREAACGVLGDRALVRLAIVGDESDARWLLARMQAAPSAAAVEAVGWAGLVEAVPALIALLETSEDDEVKLAAGAALERMLGAGLVDAIEVMAEAMDEAEVSDPDVEAGPPMRPLAEMVTDPRLRPPPPAKETLEIASIDPARWGACWTGHASRLDPKQRTRRGQAYSCSVSLYELDQLALSAEDRRRLHRELSARTGRVTAFDPCDFVPVQVESLERWAAVVRATRDAPGTWGRARP
jgi:hypothetical protein